MWYKHKNLKKIQQVKTDRENFITLAKELGVYNMKFYLHHVDKIFLLHICGENLATSIHEFFSSHHNPITEISYLHMILDWEIQGRKEHKTAYDLFITKYNNDFTDDQKIIILNLLMKYNLL